jgi:xanthine dehydrogenase accessory factor
MSGWATLARAVERQGPCVMVSIMSTQGSVPRGTDAWMIVTTSGFHGSIGGGTLEWRAMAEAQSMLQQKAVERQLDYVLGPDLGQCCGGRVKVCFRLYTENDLALIKQNAERAPDNKRAVFIFGAGHVGRALVLALAPLPFDVQWVDQRPGAFPAVQPANVKLLQPEDPLSCIASAPRGSLAFVMSHSHTLDLALVDACLRQTHMAHVGLIGSATKRARFEKRLLDGGLEPSRVKSLICPIGVGGITSKHPAAIASSVAAQVLQLDSALASNIQTNIRLTGTLA